MRRILFALFLIMASATGAAADPQEAAKSIRKAAEQGHAQAQFNLGMLYYNGEGVPQDYQEAVKWHRKAAEQGDASAQGYLGVMYEKGRGVPQDFVRAHMWYNVGAAALSGDEKEISMTDLRDDVASRMTAAQIGKAQEMARRCQETKFKECG